MTARGYLFVSKATVQWCLARYLATDHPENTGAWEGMYPFRQGSVDYNANNYGNMVGQRRQLSEYLRSRPDPFLPQNWTFIDVTNWWSMSQDSAAATANAQLATMSSGSQAFMRSLTDDSQVLQWAHVMDPELATQWLKRAMKVTPAEIGALPPARQLTVIAEMWGAFGQYWKAMNIAPQGWAKYRAAWEYYARPANAQIVLRDGRGMSWPRPSTVPLWPRRDGQWYPEDAPKYLGPWRWEAILANEQWGQARTGHTRLDANVTVRFGSVAHYRERFNDNGSAQWGAPVPYAPVGGDGRFWACQDWVIYGGLDQPTGIADPGTCFAPTGEVHAFWIDNAGMMSGGMDPVWMGVTENTVGANLAIPNGPWTNRDPIQHMSGLDDVLSYVGIGSELRAPSSLVTPGSPPRRRPRYLWGVTRCADAPPNVEVFPASSFYARFDVSGAKAYDWTRSLDAQSDSIAVRDPSGEPRTSGAQTWNDGILTSIPPGGWGKDYVGWPVTGATWSDLVQTSTGSKVPGQWSRAVPYDIVGFSGFTRPFEGASNFSLVFWQPPAKRYVDLLWPLLMYLDSKTPQEVAYEVKMDVLGKNGFSLRALGDATGTSAALMSAENRFRQNMVDARAAAQAEADRAEQERLKPVRLVLGIVQAIATVVVSAVASPAAGAVVGSAFSLLNGAINLGTQANRSTVWNLTGVDVFGRPDGVSDSNMITGNFERYAIYPIMDVQQGIALAVGAQIYTTMRYSSRVPYAPNGFAGWWPGFVVESGDPYPVGFPAPNYISLGVILTPEMLVTMATSNPPSPVQRLRNLETRPKPQEPDDIKPVTLAAAAAAGLAVGALISEATRDA